MANGEAYTVKEILAQMDARITARLDKIEGKLDAKVDKGAHETLERLVHELDRAAVRREGPIVQELRKFEDRVEVLEDTALNPDKVKMIITDTFKEEKTESFDYRTKMLGAALVIFTIVNSLLNFLSLGPDVVK